MNISKKAKSDIIFWAAFGLIVAFLYLTPWGTSTRTWIGGFFLSSPNMESSKLDDNNILSNDWNFEDTTGEQFWLSDTDKPVFINVWATWCGPCRSEMPSIKSLYDKYNSKVEFILVSPNETLQEIQKFATDNQYNLPFSTSLSAIPTELQSNSYPTTFILDSNKNIIYKLTGAHDWDSEEVHHILDDLTQ